MTDPVDDQDARRGEVARLQQRLREAERTIRQLRRENERAESFALRSKQAILGTNQKLQDSIRDLEEAKLRAERASDAKGRFVATISHELRTPMNGILGTAELLAHADIGAEGRELVSIIERSAKGLLNIISDVLDFSKAENGRIALEEVTFDLHAALQAIADLELNAARKKAIDLSLVIAADVPHTVAGDPVRLRQVLLNLLDNAVKFTLTGGVRLEVVCIDAERLGFRVQDTGIGIDPNVHATIFDPFVQADSSTTRRFGGSGLGLAICRHLVGLMGGELTVRSVLGQGSTFAFECRLRTVADLPVAAAPEPGPPLTPLRMRVLAVDDNAVNRLIAVRMLEKLGCAAAAADGGRQAIELAAAGGFDLILMDCSMPDIDGLQATAAIRALDAPRGAVPIVALTAHALGGDRERCLAAGMDDYLTKPIQLARLQEMLVGIARRKAAMA